ncbi:hypothetical protein R3P38DRAFT_2794961 [Favolaschia claudopus]|uniref:Uncharacterized protein n=1 Tax=Favolaschia claudopus TaxID=2862362 RepID=A0AAW0A994_9AGAR
MYQCLADDVAILIEGETEVTQHSRVTERRGRIGHVRSQSSKKLPGRKNGKMLRDEDCSGYITLQNGMEPTGPPFELRGGWIRRAEANERGRCWTRGKNLPERLEMSLKNSECVLRYWGPACEVDVAAKLREPGGNCRSYFKLTSPQGPHSHHILRLIPRFLTPSRGKELMSSEQNLPSIFRERLQRAHSCSLKNLGQSLLSSA